ncbi:MAG: hypothetical protein QNJ17_16545, partial [Desulfocapsaceae bacterium]|nr:hypothetical protein [Desulfocapsaceae bacterium]
MYKLLTVNICRMLIFFLFSWLLVEVIFLTTSFSGEVSTEPFLRLETGMHTARIWRIDVDRDQRFAVTGSDDKTVRLWDLKNGNLLHIFRLPIQEGNVGKVYSVAISPDGDTIAAGGWTGSSGLDERIFIFNRRTADIRKVISGLPNVVLHLTYSPDGKHLAATQSENGIRVYETQRYTQVVEDSEYGGDRCNWADFDIFGRLVTTSYDGHIRLYSYNFELPPKKSAPIGHRPYAVEFSPDGRRFAVGYSDTTKVDVFAADSLEFLYSADTSGTNYFLNIVSWSTYGDYLYAGGGYNAHGYHLIRRWFQAGEGDFAEFKASESTIMGIKPLADGSLVVGAADPCFSLLAADGNPIWEQKGDIAIYREQIGDDGIKLSSTGDQVQFGYQIYGERQARFSISTGQLELEPAEVAKMQGPVIQVPELEITDWDYSYSPKLNGTPLVVDELERSRSLAIDPKNEGFLLGTEWYLRFFDNTGNQLWQADAPDVTWAVNISADGNVAVAGFGDGTLRWYRLSDGEELLALFPHVDGKRWVAWTPNGFYHASAGAEDLIGWHLNQGADKIPEFFGASRFREQFYRPDVVTRVLETLDVDKALALADKDRGTVTTIKNIKSILPPTITILSPATSSKTTANKLAIVYKA